MPPPARRNGPAYRKIVARLEDMMETADVQQKELAAAVGVSETTMSQKLRGTRSHLYFDELELAAEFFRNKTGRPLIGFPYLEMQTVEIIDRRVAGWKPPTHHGS